MIWYHVLILAADTVAALDLGVRQFGIRELGRLECLVLYLGSFSVWNRSKMKYDVPRRGYRG